ncbi:sirohydrochlorin chelatase [Desertibacillus haloalkaliphilus]|uniref:sirohydrochlorin chelatase n=1 Tax=Desertibacillus haloalkaliphilus TaxID=1328930 RepID=UPI001C269AD6|nr:sirohydrochlorin chelatase [Desertibacillus haloalkaliphilus]MBU8907804.1 sirohydrochlorin chelatase [Desertibacillus haloalkaliphilus]
MEAVLYVGHGSRVEQGNEQLRSFVSEAMASVDITIQELCFIELTEPTIASGIDACVKRGATSIAIIPVLLLTAGHAKVDIPREIMRAQTIYPDITFRYGRPFGVTETVITVIGERLKEKGFLFESESRPTMQERQDVSLLVVGRGSSDPDANSDLAKISRLVWEHYPVTFVETCYLAATSPSFDEGLDRVLTLPTKTVYVLPYLLFTGVLMKRMEEKIDSFQRRNKQVILCDYLGFHSKLIHVLIERVNEVVGGRYNFLITDESDRSSQLKTMEARV